MNAPLYSSILKFHSVIVVCTRSPGTCSRETWMAPLQQCWRWGQNAASFPTLGTELNNINTSA
eukprot:134547-Amphidinium_carterae.3